jgi:RimJ/RimL family protein N-acetyltransferase
VAHRVGPTTRRLEHRAFTVDDAEVFFALNSHPEVIRFTGQDPVTSLEAAREAIAEYPDFEAVGFGRWACVFRETQEVIGFCGLKYLPELEEVDVGYRFLPEYWGRGLATEACRASLEFGLTTLELERIVGLVLAENVGSIRVLEKVGMQPDGEVVYHGIRALRYAICR